MLSQIGGGQSCVEVRNKNHTKKPLATRKTQNFTFEIDYRTIKSGKLFDFSPKLLGMFSRLLIERLIECQLMSMLGMFMRLPIKRSIECQSLRN